MGDISYVLGYIAPTYIGCNAKKAFFASYDLLVKWSIALKQQCQSLFASSKVKRVVYFFCMAEFGDVFKTLLLRGSA